MVPRKTSFPLEKIRIVLLEGVHDSAVEVLESEGFTVECRRGALSGDELRRAIADAHAVGIRSKTQLDEAAVGCAPRLLTIGCFCIGTNQVDLGAARSRGVPVFNAPFSNTRSVAELTIAEIVCLLRKVTLRSEQMHRGVWEKSASGCHEVRGRTLGIVGYGRIGSQVSVLAEAMGMRVLFYDAHPVLAMGNAQRAESLIDLLERSDVVSLHVPETVRTKGLLGRAELARMRPGAALINNARGEVVDVQALADALRSGQLIGAAVDVFPSEPETSGHGFASELSGIENVILTPHIAGSTEEAQRAIGVDVADKLARFINTGSTVGAVNVPEVDLPEQPGGSSDVGVGGVDESGGGVAHRILHFHRNVPGVLNKMHAAIAEIGGNVAGEYLRTDGDLGYVVLDVDPTDAGVIVDRLRVIPETIRVRLLW